MTNGVRGQVSVPQVIFFVFVGLIVLTIGIAAFNSNGTLSGFSSSLSNSVTFVSDSVMNVFGPIFNLLLGLDKTGLDANNQFLIVLTFVLISIIVVGTLDSVNLFGENDSASGHWINFAVGVIVSIIGVRFMPADLWASLAAPSSAFVATILVGLPFLAFFFVTMKLRSHLARKVLWLFYLVFLSYLILFRTESSFKWVYSVFLLLAAIMMFFDSTVRHYFYKEKSKMEIEDLVGKMDAVQRFKTRRNIEKWTEILNDPTASAKDRGTAKGELKKLFDKYGDLSVI